MRQLVRIIKINVSNYNYVHILFFIENLNSKKNRKKFSRSIAM